MAVRAFARHPDAAIVYGHSALVDESNRLMHYNWSPRFSRRLLKMHNFIIQPAAFVRRSVLESKLVDERFDYAMDRELWLRLTENWDAVRVPEVLAIDRHRDDRKSYTRLDLYEQDVDLLVRRYGVPPLGKMQARVKLAKVALRIAGSSLAMRSSTRQRYRVPNPANCNGTAPSTSGLASSAHHVPLTWMRALRRRVACTARCRFAAVASLS